MSLKDTDVRTSGDKEIAKKFKLSLARVRALVKVGAKHEKEHNTDQKKAEEVARDHISERPDYYKMLSKAEKTDKNHMNEESGIGGVRGLGYVSGDPAGTNYVQQYLDTNAMSYEDENGNKLEWIKKKHSKLHGKLGFKSFDPTNIDNNKNFVAEGISAGPEEAGEEKDGYRQGDPGGGRTVLRKTEVKEDFAKIKKKLSKAAKVGSVVGALGAHAGKVYDVGNVVSHHDDPGLATATAVSYLHPGSRMLQAAPTVLKVDKAGKGENEFKRQKLYGGKKLQVKEEKQKYIKWSDHHNKTFRVTDPEGDPNREGFSIVTPENGKAWTDWKDRPSMHDVARKVINKPGSLSYKYHQIKRSAEKQGIPMGRAMKHNEPKDENDMVKEDKDPCWKGYEMVGMKKKGGRKVPNCVPVNETGQVMSRYTERPTYEGEELPKVGGIARDIYETSVGKRIKYAVKAMAQQHRIGKELGQDAEKDPTYQKRTKGINRAMKEGYASIGHAYDWAGDVNPRAKFYGDKPKATNTKKDEKDDTYKDSNKGKKVRFAKTVKEGNLKEFDIGKTARNVADTIAPGITSAYDAIKQGDYAGAAEKAAGSAVGFAAKRLAPVAAGVMSATTTAKASADEMSPEMQSRIGAARQSGQRVGPMNEIKASTVGRAVAKAAGERKELTSKKMGDKEIKQWWKRERLVRRGTEKLTGKSKVSATLDDEPPFTGSHKRSHEKSSTHVHRLAVKGMKKQMTKEDANRPDRDLEAKTYGGATGLTRTIHEETIMDTKDKIQEAIGNIMEENLHEMKDNFLAVLQEKAQEKLEERKKDIAANYFAQD